MHDRPPPPPPPLQSSPPSAPPLPVTLHPTTTGLSVDSAWKGMSNRLLDRMCFATPCISKHNSHFLPFLLRSSILMLWSRLSICGEKALGQLCYIPAKRLGFSLSVCGLEACVVHNLTLTRNNHPFQLLGVVSQ